MAIFVCTYCWWWKIRTINWNIFDDLLLDVKWDNSKPLGRIGCSVWLLIVSQFVSRWVADFLLGSANTWEPLKGYHCLEVFLILQPHSIILTSVSISLNIAINAFSIATAFSSLVFRLQSVKFERSSILNWMGFFRLELLTEFCF